MGGYYANTALKLDNLQITGAFKERGAANRLALLSADERGRPVTVALTTTVPYETVQRPPLRQIQHAEAP